MLRMYKLAAIYFAVVAGQGLTPTPTYPEDQIEIPKPAPGDLPTSTPMTKGPVTQTLAWKPSTATSLPTPTPTSNEDPLQDRYATRFVSTAFL
ncbi:hypothetical protein DSO57_1030212 [Entomophthora muscae]|uniref:Uncharacterized protein n=1 Tax=Entomophthora muscae TaxID=34485 RepID=A0ACC2TN50_9FUNG|nr:hypothetical protein DSO57_1030212 [Entomophthora muscae]